MYQTLRKIYRGLHKTTRRTIEKAGLTVFPTSDFYSPLPSLAELERYRDHWDRPSQLVGIDYDLEVMKVLWQRLLADYGTEYAALPPYPENKSKGFGPGFTFLDAPTLYFMLRDIKPRRMIEVGSGLSTFYSLQALAKNREEGHDCDYHAVDPFPRQKLIDQPGVTVHAKPAQDVPLEFFGQLEAGDVLFIDTTHVLKVGGEVAYLYLEVVPRVAKGVTVHAHDIPFPYNTPYPAEQWVFNEKWPKLWTEPMLIQAFLAYNREFSIQLSLPMLRHFCEQFLAEVTPDYRKVEVPIHDTFFGSLWFRRLES